MNFSKLIATAIIGLLSMATKCGDPGDPDGGGKVRYVPIAITNGTTLTKDMYGLWRAADEAPKSCRWSVTKKGKNVASGGKYDAIIVTRAMVGGTVHAKNCGKFRQ